MPVVEWSDSYGVNVEEIDAQHRRMLELVNNVHEAVEERVDKNDLVGMLVELVEFTRAHFSTEEKLMKEHGFPDFAAHHREHRMLTQYLVDLVDAVSGGKALKFYSDYDVTTDWALTHIFAHDKNLGAFLNSKGVY